MDDEHSGSFIMGDGSDGSREERIMAGAERIREVLADTELGLTAEDILIGALQGMREMSETMRTAIPQGEIRRSEVSQGFMLATLAIDSALTNILADPVNIVALAGAHEGLTDILDKLMQADVEEGEDGEPSGER